MNYYNFDEDKLIDKGWRQMEKTLDKRMPVKRRYGKRYAAALILFLIVLLSGLGYKYFIVALRQKNVRLVQSFDKIPAIPPAKIWNVKTSSFDSSINRNNENKNKENLHFKSKKILDIQKQKKRILHRTSDTGKAFAYQKIEGDRDDEHKNIKKLHVVSPGFLVNTGGEFVHPKLNYINHKNNMEIDFLPSIKLYDTKIPGYSWSVTVGALSENGQSFGGGNMRLLYRYRFNRFMSLEAGVDFTVMIKNGMINSFYKTYNLTDPIFDIEASRLDPDSYNKNYLSPVFLSKFIDDLYYAGIPVNLAFNYGATEIMLGVKLNYMVAGTNYVVKRGRIGDFTYKIPEKTTFYDKDIYRKWDINALLGFNLKLSHRLSIRTEITYSFNGIIKSPGSTGNGEIFNTGVILYRYNKANRYDKNVYGSLCINYSFGMPH